MSVTLLSRNKAKRSYTQFDVLFGCPSEKSKHQADGKKHCLSQLRSEGPIAVSKNDLLNFPVFSKLQKTEQLTSIPHKNIYIKSI